MADRSRVCLEDECTMEGERESFSNRDVKRKILPENNVLTGQSVCSFLAKPGGKPWLATIAAKPGTQSKIVLKVPESR